MVACGRLLFNENNGRLPQFAGVLACMLWWIFIFLLLLFLACSLQELLKNVSQSRKGDANVIRKDICTSTVASGSTFSQRNEGVIEQRCGASGLVSLLQCSNPRSIASTLERETDCSASKLPQEMKQTATLNNQLTPVQPIIYVKPMGQNVNLINQGPNQFESVPFSPSSRHSGASFFNPPVIRGLSPQCKPMKMNYQINVTVPYNHIESSHMQQNISKSSTNDLKSQFSTMMSNINASISSARRNLEVALNGQQTDSQHNRLPNRRVRMGWSPLKRGSTINLLYFLANFLFLNITYLNNWNLQALHAQGYFPLST